MASLEEIMALRRPNNTGVDPKAVLAGMSNLGSLPQAFLFGMGAQEAQRASSDLNNRMMQNIALIRGAQQDAVQMDRQQFEDAMKAHSAFMSEKAHELRQQELAIDRAYKMGSLGLQSRGLALREKEMGLNAKRLEHEINKSEQEAEIRKVQVEEQKLKLENLRNAANTKIKVTTNSGETIETNLATLGTMPASVFKTAKATTLTEQQVLNNVNFGINNLGLSSNGAVVFSQISRDKVLKDVATKAQDIFKKAEDNNNTLPSMEEAYKVAIASILSGYALDQKDRDILSNYFFTNATMKVNQAQNQEKTEKEKEKENTKSSKPAPSKPSPAQTISDEQAKNIGDALVRGLNQYYPRREP